MTANDAVFILFFSLNGANTPRRKCSWCGGCFPTTAPARLSQEEWESQCTLPTDFWRSWFRAVCWWLVMLVMVSSIVDYELLQIWLIIQRLATRTGPTLQTAFFCTTLLEVWIWPDSDLIANYQKSVPTSTLVCHLAASQRLWPTTTREVFQGKSPTKLIQGKVSVEIGGEDRPGFRSAAEDRSGVLLSSVLLARFSK